MSFSADVAELTEALGPFYEYVAEGLEEEEEDESISDSGIELVGNRATNGDQLLKLALGTYEEEEGKKKRVLKGLFRNVFYFLHRQKEYKLKAKRMP